MPLVQLIVLLAVFGFVVWLITTYIPMNPQIQKIIVVIAVIGVVIFLLKTFNLMPAVTRIRI